MTPRGTQRTDSEAGEGDHGCDRPGSALISAREWRPGQVIDGLAGLSELPCVPACARHRLEGMPKLGDPPSLSGAMKATSSATAPASIKMVSDEPQPAGRLTAAHASSETPAVALIASTVMSSWAWSAP